MSSIVLKRTPEIPPARRAHVELLRNALAASKMLAQDFARNVLLRDERTLRRYLNGEVPIPGVVVEFLTDYMAKASWRS